LAKDKLGRGGAAEKQQAREEGERKEGSFHTPFSFGRDYSMDSRRKV
jgi:hypothetical protein